MAFPLVAEANVICWETVPQSEAPVELCHSECRDKLKNGVANRPANNFVILRSPMCGRYTITTEIRHNYCHYVTLSGIDFDIDVLAEREKQMASEPKRVRASDAG